MTKEITKATIIQEIQDKFKLREYAPAKFLFDETVIPVYDVEQHLTKSEILSSTVSVTSSDHFNFFIVPEDEQWRLHGYNVIFMTGAYTVAGLMRTAEAIADGYIYLDLKAAQSVSYAVNLPKDEFLESNDRLRIYVDGYTSTGNLMVIASVTKEEIR